MPDLVTPWARLRVAALTPFTSVDFPGHLAAVVHMQGCPLACPYCHSPHLQPASAGTVLPSDIASFLEARRGLLNGIVFTGGEPCAQTGLADALATCRSQGYATALHSSGVYPSALARLLPMLDWVGLDWKAPPVETATAAATGRTGLGPHFTRALRVVLDAGINHEIRTTWHPTILPEDAVIAMAEHLARAGASSWVIQPFWWPTNPTSGAGTHLDETAFPMRLLTKLRMILPNTTIRTIL